MSATQLAQLIDELANQGAYISEGEKVVNVSNLGSADARRLMEACAELGWEHSAHDTQGTEWPKEELEPSFEPFLILVRKPAVRAETLAVLTLGGLQQLLKENFSAEQWMVGQLTAPIVSWSTLFVPWDREMNFEPYPATKNPRELVREFGTVRRVPADIRRWLLKGPAEQRPDDPAYRVWARAAAEALLLSLPTEVDTENSLLKFIGPPRLTLRLPPTAAAIFDELQDNGFSELQQAAKWVFENEREAAMRHMLLETEIARSVASHDERLGSLKVNLAPAAEGAKIAYQMSLAGVSADTLKALADLRKAVTEETAKVTETTRQIVAAVASAFAVGIGLIAARLATKADPILVAVVMLIVLAYIAMVILSGVQFALLQKGLRRDWQPRLYRFLPRKDYQKLVATPASRAERVLWLTACIGGAAVILLSVTVFVLAFWPSSASESAESSKPPGVAQRPNIGEMNKVDTESANLINAAASVDVNTSAPSGPAANSAQRPEVSNTK